MDDISRLQMQGELEKAYQLCQTRLEQNPHDSEALHAAGQIKAQQNDLTAAVDFLNQALELSPNDPVFHNSLGNVYKKNRQADLARIHYEKAIQLAPDYALAHSNLAGILSMENKYHDALEHYRQALHARPDFTAAHFNLGLLLLRHGELKAAAIQFKNVLALDAEHQEAEFYSGVLALEEGDLKNAGLHLHNVLQKNENHVEALCNLGVLALKENEPQQAIDYFSKALALDNDHPEARNNLAATFMHHDRFENALMHYDVLLKQEPDNLEYLYNSGVAQMSLGHLKEAVAHFEHLLRKKDDHFAALNNLAAIAIRQEDKIKARELLERAVAANPADQSSRHMLAALTGNKADTCPEYTANLFDNYALYYDSHLKNFLHYTLPNHILAVIDGLNIQHVDDALDLGCGTGLTGQVLRDICDKLTGVDISAKMLKIAEEKGIYDELHCQEILEFLSQNDKKWNLLAAADVLPYFGELEPLLEATARSLMPEGIFIFNNESSTEFPWVLTETARFAHHPDYIKDVITGCGLKVIYQKEVTGRKQQNQDVPMILWGVKY